MVALLSDEDVPGSIIHGLQQFGDVNLVRAQDVGLSHTKDSQILDWAGGQGRAIVSRDRQTMVGFAYDRVMRGLAMAGLFILSDGMSVRQAIDELRLIPLATDSSEWKDRVVFLPLR